MADRTMRVLATDCVAEVAQGGAVRSGVFWRFSANTVGGVVCLVKRPLDVADNAEILVGVSFLSQRASAMAGQEWRIDASPIVIGQTPIAPVTRSSITNPVTSDVWLRAGHRYTRAELFANAGTPAAYIRVYPNGINGIVNLAAIDIEYTATR